MKCSLPFLFVGLPLLMSGCSVQTEVHIGDTNGQAKPRLVVGITVDQMRADYLTRFGAWEDASSPATFSRVDSAAWLKRVLHVATTTLDTPRPTQVRDTLRSTQEQHPWCTASWPTIGTTAQPLQACTAPRTPRSRVHDEGVDTDGLVLGSSGQMSPHRMLSTTLGDELKMATGGQAKVYGVSMKDRGAILPAAMVRMVRFGFTAKNSDTLCLAPTTARACPTGCLNSMHLAKRKR